VRDAVGHAAVHLQRALNETLGEVAASGGDAVLDRVRELRGELLTGTGRPRAGSAYQEAIDARDRLLDGVASLEAAVQAYREQVDQLRALRTAHDEEARTQPWATLRTEQGRAEAALADLDGLARQRDTLREQVRQAAGLRKLLQQGIEAADRQATGLAARESALAAAMAAHEQARDAEQQAAQADTAAATRLQQARATLAAARQAHQRTQLTRELADARHRAAELAGTLQRATSAHERAAALALEAQRLRIAPEVMQALRRSAELLRELEIRQATVATRLSYALDAGAELSLDGQPLAGRGERLLIEPATLALPGLGTLRIAPGGADVAGLASAQARLQAEQRERLQALGLATLDEAEARGEAHRRQQAEADSAAQALALLAPKGLDALRQDHGAATARLTEIDGLLTQLPAAADAPPPVDLAERDHDSAQAAAEAAAVRLRQAREAAVKAAGALDAARRERDALKAEVDDPQRQADLGARRGELVEARSREATLAAEAEALDRRIAAARPDILRQDVERLRRSADEALRQQQARERQILQLEASLATAGAQGLEEELAARRVELAQAERRHAELRRRADALDFLLQRLSARRQALTRRLQAPLQRHIDHYLGLLFPDGRLAVGDDLAPGELTRTAARGTETGDFETLSFGAREQLGLISRLAYADLLKEAGRPTLVILDDALVHSDEQRLALMKRVLFDAAQRQQVLLFTCHPGSWRDMGVAARALRVVA
jgi:hypothetical protein